MPSEGLFQKQNPRISCAKINNDKYELFWVSIWSSIKQVQTMPKFNLEKNEICLVPKMPCVSYNEHQLFQASNVPRSFMTNMNNFEYQLCQGSLMLSFNYENINYVMTQILKLSCVSFSYVSIRYVLALGLVRG